ncbi:formyltetrahydrofolate deformylase [Celerinatantimonas yamalensis]|uniref:Formyltetrahydrofolate deformylase n=1 Tax=Celerinatantimonas yamalensis TaxID=559956 RepID=A0ABW9G2A0_9GAMM
MQHKILLTDCPDEQGLIARITSVCSNYNLNIIKNNEFVDNSHNRFFMRTELSGEFKENDFEHDLKEQLPVDGNYRLVTNGRKRIVILVTKEAHCLGDILMKAAYGDLNVEIAAVIGNYDTLQNLTEKFDIPFHFISHDGLSRSEHEQRIQAKIAQYQPEYVVLAKYMRILTPELVAAHPHRIINIHHSFLPAFIGARPYQQAYDRGVKMIGATAHFVTNNLDEGPIIEQDVIHTDHNYSAERMASAGRDVEKYVLSQALRFVLQERVFVTGNRTVVFR